jgi:hypothetical protein
MPKAYHGKACRQQQRSKAALALRLNRQPSARQCDILAGIFRSGLRALPASPRGKTISGQAISICGDTQMLG